MYIFIHENQKVLKNNKSIQNLSTAWRWQLSRRHGNLHATGIATEAKGGGGEGGHVCFLTSWVDKEGEKMVAKVSRLAEQHGQDHGICGASPRLTSGSCQGLNAHHGRVGAERALAS